MFLTFSETIFSETIFSETIFLKLSKSNFLKLNKIF
jgi:hypothetical protein